MNIMEKMNKLKHVKEKWAALNGHKLLQLDPQLHFSSHTPLEPKTQFLDLE